MRTNFDLRAKGAWGYREDGIDLIYYIHDDSYPEKFGLQILEMVAAGKYLESIIPEECVVDFLADSIMCEYAYILNRDTRELEYYRGRNTNPAAPGRYVGRGKWSPPPPMTGVSYYGVRLVKAIPFSVIQDTPVEKREGLLRE